MFDLFRKHTKVGLFIIVLLIIPSFVFFGIQGYTDSAREGNLAVASVAGRSITQDEWDYAHRSQIDRLQRQMPGLDIKLLDTPQMKQQSLESIVRERVILNAVGAFNVVTTDERLQRKFAADPQLAFLRNPDGSVNKDALAAQGLTSEMFAQRLRQDFSMNQVMGGLGESVLAAQGVVAPALDAMFQQREVQLQRFDAKDYLAKVSPSDADLEAFYKDPANAVLFQSPEHATVEYVLLDVEALKKDVKVSEEDLRKYYTENERRFVTPEERRASHILIKAEKGAPAAEREKAKAKAEALLAELKEKKATFADLARKNSDDPGSAERGGDLDFFGRGAMVKPFEDAAYGLKVGDVSGVVESDFGYHIIQLTAVRGGERRSFEQVRAELEGENKRQVAQQRFAEQAVAFSNLVEDQSDSLKPAVDKFKLELKTAKNVQRVPGPAQTGPLANPKFIEALFGNEALKNKRNTLAIDLGNSQLVSGRVVEYAPARLLPFDDVKAKVREQVAARQAAALARKEGEARLAELRKAPDTALSSPTQTVSRATMREATPQLVEAVLKAPADKLPAYVGVDLPDQGFAIAKITKVMGRDPIAADAQRSRAQYAQAWGAAEAQAYYEALKARFKAEIKAPTPKAPGGAS